MPTDSAPSAASVTSTFTPSSGVTPTATVSSTFSLETGYDALPTAAGARSVFKSNSGDLANGRYKE